MAILVGNIPNWMPIYLPDKSIFFCQNLMPIKMTILVGNMPDYKPIYLTYKMSILLPD
jgi:hypothetical protein